MTDQTAIDYRTTPPSIEPTATAWQAWWEDHEMWDGDMLYAELATAKHHSAVAYVGEEYSWLPGDDPDDEAPDRVLAWELKYGRWRLLDGGRDTGVRLGETRTYAAAAAVPAGQAPATDRAGLVEAATQAIRDSNGTPEALEWWRTHPQLIPAHVYAEAALAVLPPSVDRAAVLTYAERTMLTYALDQAQERIWSEGGFTDEDQAAVTSLRRLAAAPAAASAVPGQADEARPEVTVHAIPTPGSNGISSCCGRPPCEFVGERVTRDPDEVTCPGPEQPAAGAQQPKEARP